MNTSGEYVSNKEAIKSILSSFGYPIKENNDYIQTSAIFRMGDDPTSVAIYYDKNKVIDFVTSSHYTVNDFLSIVTEKKTPEELAKYLEQNNIVLKYSDKSQEIKQKKKFDSSLLLFLQNEHSYPISRGISENTCKLFQGGTVGPVKGKLRNRYTFPIKNSKNEIVGFSGRTLDGDKRKYMHFGTKSEWVWPAFLNGKIINNCKSVILVESAMDVLYMWENDIKNVICLFGTDLSLSVLNFLLKCNVERILIATNNEPNNDNIGNNAAEKIKGRLIRYFDERGIIIKLPFQKDFCDMNKDELQRWIQEARAEVGNKYFNYEL